MCSVADLEDPETFNGRGDYDVITSFETVEHVRGPEIRLIGHSHGGLIVLSALHLLAGANLSNGEEGTALGVAGPLWDDVRRGLGRLRGSAAG
jgi:hypothetical protein